MGAILGEGTHNPAFHQQTQPSANDQGQGDSCDRAQPPSDIEAIAQHRSHHDKSALGKIHGVRNDIGDLKPQGDQAVHAPDRYAR